MSSVLSRIKPIWRNQLNPTKKEFVKRIRQKLDLSEVDASDKDILDCFENTTMADDIRFDIADEKVQEVLEKQYYYNPRQA